MVLGLGPGCWNGLDPVDRLKRLFVGGHAGTGGLGSDIMAIDDFSGMLHPILQPRNGFKEVAGGVGEAQVLVDLTHISHMGNDRQVITTRHVRDLPELGDAGEADDIRLDIMHGSGMDEIAELFGGVELLSKRDGGADGLGQAAVSFDIIEIDGLFNPSDIEIRKATNNRLGLQDAMRGVLAAGGNHEQDWSIDRILAG